jgi:hypothetical protein
VKWKERRLDSCWLQDNHLLHSQLPSLFPLLLLTTTRGAFHFIHQTSSRFSSTQTFHSSQLARHQPVNPTRTSGIYKLMNMGESTAAIVWYVYLHVLPKSIMLADIPSQGHARQTHGLSA